MTAISLRREIDNEWMMILGGALSVLFGILLAVLPGVGLLSLTWLIGIYALIFGVAFIFLGLRIRSHGASSRVSFSISARQHFRFLLIAGRQATRWSWYAGVGRFGREVRGGWLRLLPFVVPGPGLA